MLDQFANQESGPTQAASNDRALKHVRAAALVAALVPLAQVAVSPVTVSAQELCGGTGQPPCEVPDGGSTLMMAATAAAFVGHQLRKKK